MAVQLTTIQELHDHFSGVLQRAQHHAPNVDQIIYFILGMIIAFKDSGTVIDVSGQNIGLGNLLWTNINGTRYAFQYNHNTASIEIHENTYNGAIKATITNGTTLQQLSAIFNGL